MVFRTIHRVFSNVGGTKG